MDVSAGSFWTREQKAVFDMKIFRPYGPLSPRIHTRGCINMINTERMRKEYIFLNDDYFISVLPRMSGGMELTAKGIYARLVEVLFEKQQQT